MSAEKVVIVDIDGTIADNTHRLHHINADTPDWPAFYEAMKDDKTINSIVDLVYELWTGGFRVVLLTGRPEEYRKLTEDWLEREQIVFDDLIMRPTNSYVEDTQIKSQLLRESGIATSSIKFILEDRKRIVDMWRKKGFTVLHVAEGNY